MKMAIGLQYCESNPIRCQCYLRHRDSRGISLGSLFCPSAVSCITQYGNGHHQQRVAVAGVRSLLGDDFRTLLLHWHRLCMAMGTI